MLNDHLSITSPTISAVKKFNMDVGNTLKELRALHGLSQTELARRLDITQSHLSLVESGERTLHQSVLERASSVFGMPLSVFIFLSMTEDEVAPEKREYFRQTQPKINAFLRELFPVKPEANREQEEPTQAA